MSQATEPTTEELAIAHFEAQEHVKMLGMMNVPLDYEERKKAAVEYALAQEKALKAATALFVRTGRVPK